MLRSLLFILLMMLDVGWIHGLCVYEQDFGFTLDCAFKKSTLFRIRNLGGVKGYVGIGFTVGDDLKFKESLSQEADATRRRSAPNSGDLSRADSGTGRSHSGRNPLLAWASTGGIPGQMPGVFPGVSPMAVLPPGVYSAPVVAATVGSLPTVPPFKPLGGGSLSAPSQSASSDIVTVPPFSALPPSIARIPTIKKVQIPQSPAVVFTNTAVSQTANRRYQNNALDLSNDVPNTIRQIGKTPESSSMLMTFEPSDAMPTDTLSTRRLNESPSSPSKSDNSFDDLTQIEDFDISSPSPLLMGHSVQSLSDASNISVEALAAALRLREQQLLASVTSSTPSTTTTTTTSRPTKPPTIRPKYPLVGPNRVMNAPKEYYPVSYDKNYDDNFTSKVELPETSFSCGDQKHFPGLYADEDLGCMVFHVCAFTDDGMVMKSFLCPESTLFDQSVLKCNWWFYVDCKSSKRLYDSNIPISKSYQLMKALAFFSSYKNQTTNST